MIGLYSVPCPKCDAMPYERCRSLTKGKVTDTHMARLVVERRKAEAAIKEMG